MTEKTEERLHKRIAAAGICSRRAAETLIQDGRVTVNGCPVTEMGVKVTSQDIVRVDGVEISSPPLYYLAMNKPKGVVTTMSDPHARKTVVDLMPILPATLKPVGRLDKDTEGLLLFTNDGELAQRLMHPRYSLPKEYVVTVRGMPDERALDKLSSGIWIPEGGKTKPAMVSKVYRDSDRDRCAFHLTIYEGRKRQIRQMCLAIGHPVKELKRVRIGPIELKSMPRGTSRMLSEPELTALFQAVGLSRKPDDPLGSKRSRHKD